MWNDKGLNLMGIQRKGIVKRGASAIHHMVWKHIIPELVRVDENGARFNAKAVQARAAKRYVKREEAMTVSIQLCKQRCEARGWKFDVGQFNQRLDGIAEVTDDGEIVRTAGLQKWLKRSTNEDDEESEEEAEQPQTEPVIRKEAKETLYQNFVRGGEGKRQRTA